jgi:polyisoprenoid-binding protein YceI
MRIIPLTAALLALSFIPHAAQAQIETYKFDKAHTQIFFDVNHLGFTQSYGRFLGFDGGLTFDRTKPENSKVDVTIHTNSLEMNDQKWNDHLKNADFFNVEKFPEMTFKSTGIKVTGEKTADITGDLTILGVTKPVTLATTFNKADKSPFGDEYHAGFNAIAQIKRSDFGMNYGLPMVGDDVKIILNVEAVRQEATTKNQ